ncbi:MAG: hypothetical protein DRI24_00355 [Deltaproteobacteria bacterium]|nr:MAG: hypothetical protein DRI24_00355 [Deltaproteobacteria bacterium]
MVKWIYEICKEEVKLTDIIEIGDENGSTGAICRKCFSEMMNDGCIYNPMEQMEMIHEEFCVSSPF